MEIRNPSRQGLALVIVDIRCKPKTGHERFMFSLKAVVYRPFLLGKMTLKLTGTCRFLAPLPMLVRFCKSTRSKGHLRAPKPFLRWWVSLMTSMLKALFLHKVFGNEMLLCNPKIKVAF